MNVMVRTESGSVYTVTQDGEDFFLVGDHTPTPRSESLGRKKWKIQKPKAPHMGHRWILTCFYFQQFDHPKRMPGGGKVTSPVVEIMQLT